MPQANACSNVIPFPLKPPAPAIITPVMVATRLVDGACAYVDMSEGGRDLHCLRRAIELLEEAAAILQEAR
jgi:hypothetical protein